MQQILVKNDKKMESYKFKVMAYSSQLNNDREVCKANSLEEVQKIFAIVKKHNTNDYYYITKI